MNKWTHVCPLLGVVLFACATGENEDPSPPRLGAASSAGSGGSSGNGSSTAGTSGSTSQGGSSAAGSYWTTGKYQAPAMWFELDMQTEQVFFGIEIDCIRQADDFPDGMNVELSADGTYSGAPAKPNYASCGPNSEGSSALCPF